MLEAWNKDEQIFESLEMSYVWDRISTRYNYMKTIIDKPKCLHIEICVFVSFFIKP